MKNKQKENTFKNIFPIFTISGKYKGINITEIYTDCSAQICSTGVDFFPKWKLKKNKLILELTPKWLTIENEEENMFIEGKYEKI